MFGKKLMKYYLYKILFFFYTVNSIFSQGIPSNGVQSDLRLVDLYEKIKKRMGEKTLSVNKIKGTPYFDKSFKLAEVNYFGELLKDKIYLRFNAFSDEMEIATSSLMKSSENILIKNNKVSCLIDGKIYRYLAYKAENHPPAVGYLKELFRGKNFSFFERKSKVYMQATTARTSLERSFPARFVDKTEYYFSINDAELNQIKLSKKKILSKLKSYSSSIKSFLENNDAKLKSLEDIVALFNYLDQQ